MKPKLSLLDFEKICRICLQISGKMLIINANDIIDMFMACTSIKVWYQDELPQQICSVCYEKLQDAYNLKKLCETSDKQLRKLLQKKRKKQIEINSSLENLKTENNEDKNLISIKYELFNDQTDNFSDNNSDSLSPLSNYNKSNNSPSTERKEIFDITKEEIVFDMKVETQENQIGHSDENCLSTEPRKKRKYNTTNKEKNLECEICQKVFLNKHKLKKHLVAHSNDRPFQCTFCPKAFKEKFILNKHLKTIHTDPARRKVCQICGRSIVKTSLERHLKTHENPPSYQCNECTKKFLDAETLEKHIRRVHKKETSLELYPFLCNTCGKGLISKSELKRHMNSHLKEANFKCTRCGKAYTSHAGLRSHIKVFHLNERPFVCSICSRAFPTKIILKHHMRTHTGEKPFKCLICTKTFALKCVLQTHMKVHS